MPILNIQTGQVGLVGVLPSLAYILTNDSVADILVTGYLNKEVANGISFSMPCLASVATMETPTTAYVVELYQVVHVGTNWSLVSTAASEPITLTNTHILVGNASNVATDVALSGDATISNTGALLIANTAINNAKLGNGAVSLAKLATGITPAYIIKLGGKAVGAGGSATVTITATGTVATDLAFAAIQASGTPVSIQSVTAGTDQVVVVCSADPGANTICWESHRAAS